MSESDDEILLTGATGFIGNSLCPELLDEGYEVVCTSRNPEVARRSNPGKTWRKLDVQQPSTIESAMEGCDVVFYLIHEMASGEGYQERERQAALNIRDAAEKTGVSRLVYLGGIEPEYEPSEHLRSRLRTGEILRTGDYTTIELRASMIVGPGSSSWQIVRDLAARLPAMILPEWTQSKTQPVYLNDVLRALLGAVELETNQNQVFDLPGPDTLRVEDILRITAERLGHEPVQFRVPLLTPRLSSYWLRFVTRSDLYVAQELVEGLKTDILAHDDSYWERIGVSRQTSFEEAVDRTLAQDNEVSPGVDLIERGLRYLSSPKST